MGDNASTFIAPWSSYYVMVGSSAAALTGLVFVVITVVSGSTRAGDGSHEQHATSIFSTPTAVHFGAALLISAIVEAPWHLLLHPAALLAIVGACGVAYLIRIAAQTRRLRSYRLDAEDWTWYAVLPFLAYGAVLGSAIALPRAPVQALFALAAAALLLVFIGLRNAWDIVTFLALPSGEESSGPDS